MDNDDDDDSSGNTNHEDESISSMKIGPQRPQSSPRTPIIASRQRVSVSAKLVEVLAKREEMEKMQQIEAIRNLSLLQNRLNSANERAETSKDGKLVSP